MASPICRQKTQASHVSNESDHVFYLSYLKTWFLWQFPIIFDRNFVAFDVFALRMSQNFDIPNKSTHHIPLNFSTWTNLHLSVA